MEIDSSANDLTNHKGLITSPDSYVSTTNEPAEPTSRAQVLEELRARIRELEGSPLKMRGHEEEHYKCYICKVSFLLLYYQNMNKNHLIFQFQKKYIQIFSNLFIFINFIFNFFVIRILKSHAHSARLLHHQTSFGKFMFKTNNLNSNQKIQFASKY